MSNFEDPWSSILDDLHLHDDYAQGRRYASEGDWQAAVSCFRSALRQVDHLHTFYNLYTSALGLAEVMSGNDLGVDLCRRAVADDMQNADLLENLARAQLKLNHRKQAVDAVNRGLRLEPKHPGLRELRRNMGFRRRPVLGFLGRNNFLNKILGKLTYRRG